MRLVLSLIIFFSITVLVNAKEYRNLVDLPDIDDGYNIHVMYVLPSDGIDKEYDLNSKISMLIYQIDKWFNEKTKGRLFKEGQNLKFDRKSDGRIDITFLNIDLKDEVISREGINAVNVIQPAIARYGFNDPNKVYFVVYGGSNRDVCASSQLPGHQQKKITANTSTDSNIIKSIVIIIPV